MKESLVALKSNLSLLRSKRKVYRSLSKALKQAGSGFSGDAYRRGASLSKGYFQH